MFVKVFALIGTKKSELNSALLESSQLKGINALVSAESIKSNERLSCRDSFRSCFPEGLAKGSVVSISGSGARSICFGLLGNLQSESWSCFVGFPNLGVRSMSESGICLDRSLIVSGVRGSRVSRVVSECVEAVKFVAVEAAWKPAASEARRIKQKLVNSGAVLFMVGDFAWSAGVDYSLKSKVDSVVGIEQGHGRILSQVYSVDVASKRRPLPSSRVLLSNGPEGFRSVEASLWS